MKNVIIILLVAAVVGVIVWVIVSQMNKETDTDTDSPAVTSQKACDKSWLCATMQVLSGVAGVIPDNVSIFGGDKNV